MHCVRAVVVCFHRDLWFGGVGRCSMIVMVRGEIAGKRKKELTERMSFLIKKKLFPTCNLTLVTSTWDTYMFG